MDKSTDLTENYRTILDHRERVVPGGGLNLLYGYQFYTTYGFLACKSPMARPGLHVLLAKVIDGNWHHVARPSSAAWPPVA